MPNSKPTSSPNPGNFNPNPLADQLRRNNNNVPIATLWRQAIGRGHSTATLRPSRLRFSDDDDDDDESLKSKV